MAEFIRSTDNQFEEDYLETKKKAKKWTIILIVSFILFVPTGGLSLPVLIFAAYKANRYNKEASIRGSGLEGEKKTKKAFEYLPDSFHVLHNIKVEFEGRRSELDYIIVGPSGVFVCEIKNLNGSIEADLENREWIQHKVGRKGGEYSKSFYSPVKQVGTHVYRLSNFLKENGIHTWVQGIVYFSNHEAEVYLNSDQQSIPVVQAADGGTREMQYFISEYEKSPLTDEKQVQILSLLKKIA